MSDNTDCIPALPTGSNVKAASMKLWFTNKRLARRWVATLRRAGFRAAIEPSYGKGAAVWVRGSRFGFHSTPRNVSLHLTGEQHAE